MLAQAEVIRARAYYNLLTSQAMINAGQARRVHLDNQVKKTETYFAMQKINREARNAKRASRRSKYPETIATKSERRQPIILNSATGGILWPAALQSEDYVAYRAFVEQVRAQAKSGEEITEDIRAELARTRDCMLATLRGQVRQIRGNDYVAAKRFLRNLTYELLSHDGRTPRAVGT